MPLADTPTYLRTYINTYTCQVCSAEHIFIFIFMFCFLLFVYRIWRQRCCTSANAEFFFSPFFSVCGARGAEPAQKKIGLPQRSRPLVPRYAEFFLLFSPRNSSICQDTRNSRMRETLKFSSALPESTD